MELLHSRVPEQSTNTQYSQQGKSFIKYVTNHHNISSLYVPEPGPHIKYVIRLTIERYSLTCQKNKCVVKSTIKNVVIALVRMPIREESTLGPSLMDNKVGTVIRNFKRYVLNMEAAMKTNSKQDDLQAPNIHNFINQKIISDVRLRLFNTVRN